MVSEETKKILNLSAKKAVEHLKDVRDFSIKECAQNHYLDEEYDAIEMFRFKLMALGLREKRKNDN